MRLFEWGNAHVTTINTKSGRIIKAVAREEEKSTLMESDTEMNERAVLC